jgi:hypothetical protein
MLATQVANDTLDEILTLQIMVSWAGEGACEPKRLNWWRTDLVDEAGGGDFFGRLFPKTHKWASLEAVRTAAISVDRRKRQAMAKPDKVKTLFFWGYTVDEQLAERLAFHKQNGENPVVALPNFLLDIYEPFSQEEFEEAVKIPHQKVDFKVVPNGREVLGGMLQALDESAKKLAAALLPLAPDYPMPFFRLEEH